MDQVRSKTSLVLDAQDVQLVNSLTKALKNATNQIVALNQFLRQTVVAHHVEIIHTLISQDLTHVVMDSASKDNAEGVQTRSSSEMVRINDVEEWQVQMIVAEDVYQ